MLVAADATDRRLQPVEVMLQLGRQQYRRYLPGQQLQAPHLLLVQRPGHPVEHAEDAEPAPAMGEQGDIGEEPQVQRAMHHHIQKTMVGKAKTMVGNCIERKRRTMAALAGRQRFTPGTGSASIWAGTCGRHRPRRLRVACKRPFKTLKRCVRGVRRHAHDGATGKTRIGAVSPVRMAHLPARNLQAGCRLA